MTGDDWALWSCAWSWVKAENVSDVVDGGCDGSGGFWFCAGGRTGGRAEGQGQMLDGCKEYQSNCSPQDMPIHLTHPTL
ncbi:hypothetical protein PILCRDRAFT_3322 [Piloderma croceum F 1598]|uniref:Uncharacterized protein n=1 Tax=Piloderma croceum (strain F 1598) TaxID=765440 RepID=A0A0C3CEY3_PILCF|nr:hypothetical protein PILCRDRAFT_3322 [Piloderma croceum F 1598]